MKTRFVGLLGILVCMALALSACGPKTATLNVELKDFSFTPNTFEVPAGATVTLNMTNTGTLQHEYVIMLFGKNATPPFSDDDETNIFWEHEVEKGASETVTFTAPKDPGTYEIVCGIPSHIEQGMVATLTVK